MGKKNEWRGGGESIKKRRAKEEGRKRGWRKGRRMRSSLNVHMMPVLGEWLLEDQRVRKGGN